MKSKPPLNDDSDFGAVATTAPPTTSADNVASPRRAYDRNNLDPADEEARKYDDTSEGMDWDEILETTEDDVRAGRYAYNSDDYATEEEAWGALDKLIDASFERAVKKIADENAAKAASHSYTVTPAAGS